MIPWSIAVLALLYGVMAALAAKASWAVMTGLSSRRLLPQLLWLVLSLGAAGGLLGLKAWGRALAIWTSVLMMVVLLAISALLVLVAHEPGRGFVVAVIAALQMLPIRYLRLPKVKALFQAGRVSEA